MADIRFKPGDIVHVDAQKSVTTLNPGGSRGSAVDVSEGAARVAPTSTEDPLDNCAGANKLAVKSPEGEDVYVCMNSKSVHSPDLLLPGEAPEAKAVATLAKDPPLVTGRGKHKSITATLKPPRSQVPSK